MDSQDQRGEVKRLINTLRRVTTLVQIMPFAYSSLYIVSLIIYSVFGYESQDVIDQLVYVSPVVVVSFLLLSKVLKMCAWHRTACVIPLIPTLLSVVDYYIICLDDVSVISFNSILAVMIILLLIAAYKVFFK